MPCDRIIEYKTDIKDISKDVLFGCLPKLGYKEVQKGVWYNEMNKIYFKATDNEINLFSYTNADVKPEAERISKYVRKESVILAAKKSGWQVNMQGNKIIVRR